MIETGEARYAGAVLRVLLGLEAPLLTERPVDWALLLSIGKRNGVLLRTLGALEDLGVVLPPDAADARQRERARADATVDTIREIITICTNGGIDFIFAKAMQHYPDMGRDIDLLLLARSPAVDGFIVRELGAVPVHRDSFAVVSGARVYELGVPPIRLEIQHGRLGLVGEETNYPALLFANRRPLNANGVQLSVPGTEDQIVIQAIQRVYGRLGLRLADVVYTINALRGQPVNWEYVVRTVTSLGVLPGLVCYLSYVEQIHRAELGGALPLVGFPRHIALGGWGRVEFRRGAYRFPVIRTNGRLYLHKLRNELGAGRWSAAGRLCLVPVLAAANAARRRRRARHGFIIAREEAGYAAAGAPTAQGYIQ